MENLQPIVALLLVMIFIICVVTNDRMNIVRVLWGQLDLYKHYSSDKIRGRDIICYFGGPILFALILRFVFTKCAVCIISSDLLTVFAIMSAVFIMLVSHTSQLHIKEVKRDNSEQFIKYQQKLRMKKEASTAAILALWYSIIIVMLILMTTITIHDEFVVGAMDLVVYYLILKTMLMLQYILTRVYDIMNANFV